MNMERRLAYQRARQEWTFRQAEQDGELDEKILVERHLFDRDEIVDRSNDEGDFDHHEETVVETDMFEGTDFIIRFHELELRPLREVSGWLEAAGWILDPDEGNTGLLRYRCPDCDRQFVMTAPRHDEEPCACGGEDVYPLDDEAAEARETLFDAEGLELAWLREILARREAEFALAVQEARLPDESLHPAAAERLGYQLLAVIGCQAKAWDRSVARLRERIHRLERVEEHVRRSLKAETAARQLASNVLPAASARFGEAILPTESDPRSRS